MGVAIKLLRRSTAIVFVVLFNTGLQAADSHRGKELHGQHCQRCHQSEVYTRAERMVENFSALRERVSQCELSNNLLWFDEEIDDVTQFLNQEYYEFGIK